jgi:hypothetical protein
MQKQEIPNDGLLNDIYDALVGIGCELEAITTIHRAVAIDKLGEDPLAGSTYTQDENVVAVPEWVNGSSAKERVGERIQEGIRSEDEASERYIRRAPPPERGGHATPLAIVVIACSVAIFTTLAVLF